MTSPPSLARIGALIGNPARANVLIALVDGGALTATELAFAAGVSPQTTSGHLAEFTRAGLLTRRKQGRHIYYALASPLVGGMVEAILAVAAQAPCPRGPRWKGDEALRSARTCYDHLAGRLGVAIADALVREGRIVLGEDGGEATAKGVRFLAEFGVDPAALALRRRVFCRPCLDWSERRPHLAGALGAALAARCFALGWTERARGSRAVTIPAAGRDGFARVFGIAAV
jgi:DNA-binding transcriptional ArsR family regulator